MGELWDDYLNWLIWRCGLEKEKKLSKHFFELHNMEFFYTIDRDDNREADGLDLREEYSIPDIYIKYAKEFYERKCSVMEMMVALSIRVDDALIGDPGEEHPKEFFLKMLENLGLLGANPQRIASAKIRQVVKDWLNRRFDSNGDGSPFPVECDGRDQRLLEIWDQVNSYVAENYH